ncbi:MAG TPA: BON domain-containing protein [Steroidobacteraceae bacterium]|jgi:osmotically-inducible protein OsmY|nr:BON domain-containing protein [Steroidobacteraceae bacterium]
MALVWREVAWRTVCAATLALAAGCALPPAKSPAESAADQAVENRIYAALSADPVYFYRHVDVRFDHGVADLSGYVWSFEALYRAREIAAGIPGVRRVVTSQLELEREGLTNGAAR